MCKFCHALVRVHLCNAPAPALVQQSDNRCGLQQENNGNGYDLPAVSLPGGRLTEENQASWRQVGFSDVPPFELPPVEFWLTKRDRRHSDIRGMLPRQQADGDTNRLAALLIAGDQRAAHDSLAEVGV